MSKQGNLLAHVGIDYFCVNKGFGFVGSFWPSAPPQPCLSPFQWPGRFELEDAVDCRLKAENKNTRKTSWLQ